MSSLIKRSDGSYLLETTFSEELIRLTHDKLFYEVIDAVKNSIAEAITKDFMETKFQDCVASINPMAIVNLAIARAANVVAEKLKGNDSQAT